jgi:hypothetical protein
MHRWQSKQFRQIIYGFLISLCLVLGVGAWLNPAQAQISQATVTEVLDGDQVFIQGSKVRVNSVAGAGQQVSTGASRAGLRFNNGAEGRLRPNTSLIIGQCVQIQQGGIVASGPTNACAGSVRAATRGTTFIMELEEDGTYGCKVLEGSVAMTSIEDPSSTPDPESTPNLTSTPNPTPSASPQEEIILEQGKKVSISKEGRIGKPESITAEEILAILNGSLFSGYTRQLPGGGNLQRAVQQLFPGIPLPNLGLPSIPIPSIRIPGFPF